MARADLGSQTRDFAARFQTLLNKTVADDARVVPGKVRSNIGIIGTNLTRDARTSPVKLRSASKQYACWLDIQVQLVVEDGYLTVKQSFFAVSSGPDDKNPIFHYDYERDKAAYTEAHIQVFGSNPQLDPMMLELCVKRKKKHMGELHFPVGGRRFRPALEDVIEFLIDEDLAEAKSGWNEALESSRSTFRAIQLKAAVRRDPEGAAEALRALDYTVKDPPLLKRLLRGKRQ